MIALKHGEKRFFSREFDIPPPPSLPRTFFVGYAFTDKYVRVRAAVWVSTSEIAIPVHIVTLVYTDIYIIIIIKIINSQSRDNERSEENSKKTRKVNAILKQGKTAISDHWYH